MTTVGTVLFTELWRVKIEANRDGVPGVPGSAIHDPDIYAVLAQSMSGAITMALAFYNRDKKNINRANAEHVTSVERNVLTVPILAPTTVAALNYPDMEVEADVTAPEPFDNPFGDMSAPVKNDPWGQQEWRAAIQKSEHPPLEILSGPKLNYIDKRGADGGIVSKVGDGEGAGL